MDRLDALEARIAALEANSGLSLSTYLRIDEIS